uniref:Uncharacterized protein n=1 Tax=Oryzias latipes TaxID=8090 RepID=A0A3P9HWV3_ORYLA
MLLDILNISLKGSSTLVGVCFNLLVNSAPWVSAAGGAGKVSKEEGRGAEIIKVKSVLYSFNETISLLCQFLPKQMRSCHANV